MRAKINILLCLTLIVSFSLVLAFPGSSKGVDRHGERERPSPMGKFRRAMMLNFLKDHHRDVFNAIENIKAMEREAHNLAKELKHLHSQDEKQRTVNHIRGLLEEVTRQRLEITEGALEALQEKLDELRARHHRTRSRFDEIIEHRLRKLLH